MDILNFLHHDPKCAWRIFKGSTCKSKCDTSISNSFLSTLDFRNKQFKSFVLLDDLVFESSEMSVELETMFM